jgi:undecaprenyl-diphosphatase
MEKKVLEMDARLSARLGIAERPGKLRLAAAVLAHSGDSWFWLLGLGLVWIFGPVGWQMRARAMFIGVLVTAVLVMAIKFSVRRQRPVGTWGSVYRSTDPHSFPSGHAARAAMLATLAFHLGSIVLGLSLLAWAVLVGLARIAMGVHYLSDVIAGWTLGIMMGMVLSLLF